MEGNLVENRVLSCGHFALCTLLINKRSALRIEFIKTAEKSDFLSNSIHFLIALEAILKLQFHWHAVFRHVK